MKKYIIFYFLVWSGLLLLALWWQGAMNDDTDLINNNSINTLFTGLGFVGLLITIYNQQKELEEQKKSHTLEVFENGFFTLFNIYIESRNNIEHSDFMLKIALGNSPDVFKLENNGRKLLKGASFFDSLGNCFSNVNLFNVFKEQKGYNLFGTAFRPIKDSMSSYHSSLNTLIHYITNSRIKRDDKMFYLKLIIDQCVGYEKGWLYIYSLAHYNAIPQVGKMLVEFPEIRKLVKYNEDYEHKFLSKKIS